MIDFYPTPEPLVRKMIDDISFSNVQYILEPSAGKGNICDIIRNRGEKLKIDVIEIDSNLQHILRGKGYNLVHNDFLTFESFKRYDLIIANFPFGDGDKHLQKALDLIEMHNGNLVCLVNAETIKNPYTNLRKTLVKKLNDYGASIEYIQNAFADAERKTNVEVALIKISILKEGFSVIIDNLKKAEAEKFETYQQDEIVHGDFANALVSRFNLEARLGMNLIKEYEALKPYILEYLPKKNEEKSYNDPLIKLEIKKGERYNEDFVNAYLRELRHKYWYALLGDSRFTSKYTSNIVDDLYKKLEELKEYDFSLFNIEQLTIQLNSQIVNGIEDAIIKMFDEFSHQHSWYKESSNNIHYYNGWATNKAHKINKKVIIPLYAFGWTKIDYEVKQKLNDIIKVFNYFNNEIKDVFQLVDRRAAEARDSNNLRNIDLRYFDVTFYKKGTCHIVFKDMKLLDKFNIFGSRKKGWLPPSYGKKTYKEMSREEKNIIDEFQGEEKYNAIMRDPQEYIIESNQLLLA